MTENTKIPADQNSNDNGIDRSIGSEDAHVASGGIGGIHAKNPKEGSDWLGGPQNGNETPGKSTEGAYSLGGWSGSIQKD